MATQYRSRQTGPRQLESLEKRRYFASSLVADALGIAPKQFVTMDGIEYFAANDGHHGTELFRSDGTIAGTRMVADVRAGKPSADPVPIGVVNDHVLFSAKTGDWNYTLYSTDGTRAGTTQLIPGWQNGTPLIFADKLYFISTGGLWQSDGTMAGTFMIKQLFLDSNAMNDQSLAIGDKAYLRINQSVLVTDGSADGTFWINDPASDSNDYIVGVANVNGHADFIQASDVSDPARHTAGHFALWTTDGTQGGATIVKQLPSTFDDNVYRLNLSVAGTELYFGESEAAANPKAAPTPYLWASDGTTDGTVRLGKNVDNNIYGTTLMPDGKALVIDSKGRLYIADGAAGTLTAVVTGSFSAGVVVGDDAYFVEVPPNASGRPDIYTPGDYHLWRSDGTVAGTQRIMTLPQVGEHSYNFETLDTADNQVLIGVPGTTYTYDPATQNALGLNQDTMTLDAGTLRIFGTNSDDTIKLYDQPGAPDRFVVNLNGVKRSFALSAIQKIYIYGYAGDDNIAVQEKYGKFTVRSHIWGGDGEDSIYGGGARDSIDGGAGNDDLNGGNSDDQLSGDSGDDSIVGGNGNDSESGGDGVDTIFGNKGDDVLSGGSDGSADRIDGSDGADVLIGQAVTQIFFSGQKTQVGDTVADDVLLR